MGNREDLLAGAIKSLMEKGWDRTTVRDIATAAGVSHAAIGYHFGSREALLTAALLQAMEQWSVHAEQPGEQGAVGLWNGLIASFTAQRQMWRATIDAFLQTEHNPDLRTALAAGQEEGRRGFAAGLLGIPEEELAPEDVRTLGAVQSALVSGVLMQWLVDPATAPSADEVVTGLKALVKLLE